MKVKLISDGTFIGTKVVDAETGELVEGVAGIEWCLTNYAEPAVLTLHFIDMPVELSGEAQLAVIHLKPDPFEEAEQAAEAIRRSDGH
jgi:hypothetical protein